jgi:hypothetical protein
LLGFEPVRLIYSKADDFDLSKEMEFEYVIIIVKFCVTTIDLCIVGLFHASKMT